MAKANKKLEKLEAAANTLAAKVAKVKASGKQQKKAAALEAQLDKLTGKIKLAGGGFGSGGGPTAEVLASAEKNGIPQEFPNAQGKLDMQQKAAVLGGMTFYPNDPTMASFFDKALGAAVPAIAKGAAGVAAGDNFFDSLWDAGLGALGNLSQSFLPGEANPYPSGGPAAAPASSSIPTWVWIGGGLLAAFILWKILKK